MQCPICQQAMKEYKQESSYSTAKKIEYRRTFYRCEKHDTWGRIEVPIGPLSEFDQQRTPLATAP